METIRFEDLELDAKIMRAITDMGFEAASPIQGQAIPLELQGLDIIGQAQTGTGKTAAFGIPLLQKIDPKNKKPQAIILCPTRELAIQVSEEIRRLAKYMHGVKVLPIYGGQEIGRQIRSLKDGVQVIIGTPGRVMDHMRRKTVKMDQIHTVVLDEADEMLNMGFLEDMETILSALPEERQTLMCWMRHMTAWRMETMRKARWGRSTASKIIWRWAFRRDNIRRCARRKNIP